MAGARVRRAAALLAAVLLAAGPAAAAEGAERQLTYRVAFGNLTMGDARVRLRQVAGRYEVSGTGETAGALGLLFKWRGEARTVGFNAEGRRRPLMHRHAGTWRGRTRQTELRYRPDRGIELFTEPVPDLERVTAVPAGSIRRTIDPFTAMLRILDDFARTRRCEGDARVFDGRRRYDLVVEHAGRTVLAADRPWGYAGEAYGCRLKARRIGGFFKEFELDAPEAETERLIWIARLAPETWLPVRVELSAPIGRIVGRAVMPGS